MDLKCIGININAIEKDQLTMFNGIKVPLTNNLFLKFNLYI